MSNHQYKYGCFFCKSNTESKSKAALEGVYTEAEFIIPQKVRYRRSKNYTAEEHVPLFPGYIFFRTYHDIDTRAYRSLSDIYRLLAYPDEGWILQYEDEWIAKQMFEFGGLIGISKAYYEGEHIRILDGFLKEYEGKITRVNRRAKTAQITVAFATKVFQIWLGFELIDSLPNGQL